LQGWLDLLVWWLSVDWLPQQHTKYHLQRISRNGNALDCASLEGRLGRSLWSFRLGHFLIIDWRTSANLTVGRRKSYSAIHFLWVRSCHGLFP
jgi:hypothetical protein